LNYVDMNITKNLPKNSKSRNSSIWPNFRKTSCPKNRTSWAEPSRAQLRGITSSYALLIYVWPLSRANFFRHTRSSYWGTTLYVGQDSLYLLVLLSIISVLLFTLCKNLNKTKLQNTLPDFLYMVQKCYKGVAASNFFSIMAFF